MASINGISLKNVKKFRGHEGEPLYQGNLYLNNKKIGFWSQDSWGGPDNVALDKYYDELSLDNAVHKLNTDKDYHGGTEDKPFVLEYNLERLMGDYMPLYEDEQVYKSAVKKGYAGVMVASDGYQQVVWSLPREYTEMSNDELFALMADGIKQAKDGFMAENKFIEHTVKVYRSPEDFVIGEPIKFKDIVKMPRLQDTISECEKMKIVETINADKERDMEK